MLLLVFKDQLQIEQVFPLLQNSAMNMDHNELIRFSNSTKMLIKNSKAFMKVFQDYHSIEDIYIKNSQRLLKIEQKIKRNEVGKIDLLLNEQTKYEKIRDGLASLLSVCINLILEKELEDFQKQQLEEAKRYFKAFIHSNKEMLLKKIEFWDSFDKALGA